MAPKVDVKRSMTRHRTWVNNAVNRAVKFIGDRPDGLTTSWAHGAAKELIEEIRENLASMVKKWTKVFEPQLEEDDPDNLLDEWDNNVHDISERAKNTIDELGKGIETFLTLAFKDHVTSWSWFAIVFDNFLVDDDMPNFD